MSTQPDPLVTWFKDPHRVRDDIRQVSRAVKQGWVKPGTARYEVLVAAVQELRGRSHLPERVRRGLKSICKDLGLVEAEGDANAPPGNTAPKPPGVGGLERRESPARDAIE